ncbi:hypothetical protein DM02DRAFT_293266 [Periconia macrospinosa]|uniref:Uncharacterized protein n=1 Tax=Periconia macrospinosa TaxID=97972 RepID=A0A2V1DXF1_9PLEO|nr:hypothetical protein DM02DRAFT_293266 [Periconia macrospinosa]
MTCWRNPCCAVLPTVACFACFVESSFFCMAFFSIVGRDAGGSGTKKICPRSKRVFVPGQWAMGMKNQSSLTRTVKVIGSIAMCEAKQKKTSRQAFRNSKLAYSWLAASRPQSIPFIAIYRAALPLAGWSIHAMLPDQFLQIVRTENVVLVDQH